MIDAAVIFDVDGPLLDLTTAEEDVFFAPLIAQYGLTNVNRDWDSYKTRNDEEIYAEILEQLIGSPPSTAQLSEAITAYGNAMQQGYAEGRLKINPIPGALALLQKLSHRQSLALGIATANVLSAASVRLQQAEMWPFVKNHPGTADGGGAKSEILARVLRPLNLPSQQVVFLGDNLNDLEAAKANNTHFIGFHIEQSRRQRLLDAGAEYVTGDHQQTLTFIDDMLANVG